MTFYVLALLIGVIAGLRAMTAPALVSWLAYHGGLDLNGTWLSFLGNFWVHLITAILAIVELITDQLPSTPSRKVPVQFGARIVMGAVAGGAIGAANGSLVVGAILGIIGAVIGTYGGAALRARLASAFGKDRPAALVEDLIAIGGAVLIGLSLQ